MNAKVIMEARSQLRNFCSFALLAVEQLQHLKGEGVLGVVSKLVNPGRVSDPDLSYTAVVPKPVRVHSCRNYSHYLPSKSDSNGRVSKYTNTFIQQI